MIKSHPIYRPVLIGLALLSAAMFSSYFAAYSVAYTNRHIMEYASTPFITDTDGFVINSTPAGRSVVLNIHVLRRGIDCWAEYVTTLSGPVTYQFPERKSQPVTMIDRSIRILLVLPEGLPGGEYRLRQFVFPTCKGISLVPYEIPSSEIKLEVK